MIHIFHKWEVVDHTTKLCSVCDMIRLEYVFLSDGDFITKGLIGKKFAKTKTIFGPWKRSFSNDVVFSKFIRLVEDYKETRKIMKRRNK